LSKYLVKEQLLAFTRSGLRILNASFSMSTTLFLSDRFGLALSFSAGALSSHSTSCQPFVFLCVFGSFESVPRQERRIIEIPNLPSTSFSFLFSGLHDHLNGTANSLKNKEF